MNKSKRQTDIILSLQNSNDPISANTFAAKLNVSRQLIVGDIALLRAAGHDIQATHQGYILNPVHLKYKKQLVFKHKPDQTRQELEILVKHHCNIIDVIVEHPSYGSITGSLNIKSISDVNTFINQDSPLISILTDGVHTHTIEYDDPKNLENAIKELKKHKLLYD